MVPGAGKTESAIAFMNAHRDRRFIFVTPYLEEDARIVRCCPALYFKEPESYGYSTKSDDIVELIRRGENIASTHALFERYNRETVELIRERGYTLIMDEVMNVVKEEKMEPETLKILFESKTISLAEDGLHVVWSADHDGGKDYKDLKRKADMGNLLLFQNAFLFWTFPVEFFDVFEEVYILTYMFKAQVQSYYYQMHGVGVDFIFTRRTPDGRYEFSREYEAPEYAKQLASHVHICEDSKLNRIGSDKFSLSKSWFNKSGNTKEQPKLKKLRNNINTYFRTRMGAKCCDVIWTVFKDYRDLMDHNGFKSSFVSCTTRATNEWRDRHYLAYCINVFFRTSVKNYFTRVGGLKVDEDAYALSEMVQWTWRSAIRCGEDVYIYVPSHRMRTLLEGWLQRLADGQPY